MGLRDTTRISANDSQSKTGAREFYEYATEHLADALAAVFGDGTFATRHKLEELRERLLTHDDGADSVIGAPWPTCDANTLG
jgi:ribosomal 50S subunit-associated protein YjgA (DUF615 family)